MNITLNETLEKIANAASNDTSPQTLEKARTLLLEGNIDAAETELRKLNDTLLRFAIVEGLHSAALANLSAEVLESFIKKFTDIFKRANWDDSIAREEMIYLLFPLAKTINHRALIEILKNGDFRLRAQQELVLKLLNENLIEAAHYLAGSHDGEHISVYAQERATSEIKVALAGVEEMAKLGPKEKKSFRGGLPIHWIQDAIKSATRKYHQADSYDITRFIGEAMKIFVDGGFGPADKNVLGLIAKLSGKQMVNAGGQPDGRDEGAAATVHAIFDAIDKAIVINDVETAKAWLTHADLLIKTWYLSWDHVEPTKIRQAKALFAIGEIQEAENILKVYKFKNVQSLQLLQKFGVPANELVKSIITAFGEKVLEEGKIAGSVFDILVPLSEHYGLSIEKYLDAASKKSIDDFNGKDSPMLRRVGRIEDAKLATGEEHYPFDRSDSIEYYLESLPKDFKTVLEELNYFPDPGYKAIVKIISLATNCEELTKATLLAKSVDEKDLYKSFFFEPAFPIPLSFDVNDKFLEALKEVLHKIKDQKKLFQVVTYMRNYLRGHVDEKKLDELLQLAMKPLPTPLNFPEHCKPEYIQAYKMILAQKDSNSIHEYLRSSWVSHSDAWKDRPYRALIGSALFACSDKFSDEQKESLIDNASTLPPDILYSDNNYDDKRRGILQAHKSYIGALTALCFSFAKEEKKLSYLLKVIALRKNNGHLKLFCDAVIELATKEWIDTHLNVFVAAVTDEADIASLKSMPEKVEQPVSPWDIYSTAKVMLADFPNEMSNKDVDAFAKPIIRRKHPQVVVTDVSYTIPELIARATDKEYAMKMCLDLLDITQMLPRDRSIIYAALGSSYIKMGDSTQAKIWFDKAIECSQTEKKSTHFTVGRFMRAFLLGGDFKGLDEYLKTLILSIHGAWEENRLLRDACSYCMNIGRGELFFDLFESEPFSKEDKSWAAWIWMRDVGSNGHSSYFTRMLPLVASNPEHFSDSLYFLFRQFLQEKNPEAALELLNKIET